MGLGLAFSHPDNTTFEVQLNRDSSKSRSASRSGASRSISPNKTIQSGLVQEYEQALQNAEGDLDDTDLVMSGMMVDTMMEVHSSNNTPVPTPRHGIDDESGNKRVHVNESVMSNCDADTQGGQILGAERLEHV